MKAREVIRIGRRRVRAACTAASPEATPSSSLLARELDDQDGVLGNRADQNNEGDLRENLDGHPSHEQALDGRSHAQRHDQDDRQGQLPAFVLRDENEEDEESGCAEDEESRRAALLLLESKVRPLKSNTIRKTFWASSSILCNAAPVATPGAATPCTSAAGKR